MTREEIEKGDSGFLIQENDSDILLVTFGGIGKGLGIPVFEFFNTIKDLKCDKIFIRDFHQAWYQKGIDSEINSHDRLCAILEKHINSKSYKHVVFLGNSMGGYAAMVYGSLNKNVDRVIAFAPQSFYSRWLRFRHFDRRWSRFMKPIYSNVNKIEELFDLRKWFAKNGREDLSVEIYYAQEHRLDRLHAERLRNYSFVKLKPLLNSGHAVVKKIRDEGKLLDIISKGF